MDRFFSAFDPAKDRLMDNQEIMMGVKRIGQFFGDNPAASAAVRKHMIKPALFMMTLLALGLILSNTALAACYYEDADSDGYGNPAVEVCGLQPAGYVSDNTDCDDSNGAIHPGSTEVCEDSLDNDCDGNTDEGCQTWYQDSDNDTYGNASVSAVSIVQPVGYVLDSTDCDDLDGGLHPGATEICDGSDNNCDSIIDEGCTIWYRDLDGDGYGNAAITKMHFSQPVGYVAVTGDCDDNDAAINPDATEVCDSDDNDCDGSVDEGCLAWYEDSDGDTYGNAAVSTTAVTQPAGYVDNRMDCDDADAAINPASTEVCDGVNDEDCDGSLDEGCITCYQDSDADNYGNPAVSIIALSCPSGYVENNTDCNDTDPLINPGIPENSGDGIDNNCDGQIDEGATWYEDSDGDTYGNPDVSVTGAQPAGFVSDSTDCNDTDAAINPAAAETCSDGLDNDCDTHVDEGCQTWYEDLDGDTYGNDSSSIVAATQPTGYVDNRMDCDDTDAAVNPAATEVCDGIDDEDCDGSVDEGCQAWYQDFDGDSFGDESASPFMAVIQPDDYVANNLDCNDDYEDINPGATEICDGEDNNCNGYVDEGCVNKWYKDDDGDGFGDPSVSVTGAHPAGYVPFPGDCDDSNDDINPDAPEVCGDGLDNNCAGGIDEGCLYWFRDSDGDAYGDPDDSVLAFVQPDGYVSDKTDCNDTDAAVYPGAVEICDEVDSNCNGIVDEGCYTWYQDADGDLYGTPDVSTLSAVQPVGYVDNSTDCDDSNSGINPGATEVCDDSIDNDCDGSADEGCLIWYRDIDGDLYGDSSDTIMASNPPPVGYVDKAGDCDDNNADINPGMAEVCDDGLDNNCAGGVDEGCVKWYQDIDGDTYGSSVSQNAIGQPTGYVDRTGDCNDSNAAIHPDATEVCDGVDNDCDFVADEGCTTWYQDNDGDTYGNPASSMTAVSQPAGYVDRDGDCDDTDAAIHPGVLEVCDGADNDCDGIADEGCVYWYQDSDGDTYGNAAVFVNAPTQPAGYVSDNTDCNDGDAAINPGITDVCGDGIDNNCSGDVDEGCIVWYQDSDGDLYGNAAVSMTDLFQPFGYVRDNTDCDDGNALVNPGAVEVCDGIIDDNCDGNVDEGCTVWHQDNDSDGYGNPGVSVIAGAQPAGFVPDNTDCDDGDITVHPGAAEVCGDMTDNDCDGSVDENCRTWYQDADGDNYGDPSTGVITGSGAPAGYVADDTDCDDGDNAVHPGAAEICGDMIDNDCDGSVDENCRTWYQDSDGDTYGNPAVSVLTDSGAPAGYVADDTDCDDGDNAVNPGAAEICGDGIDNDCDGSVDEDCHTWYQDSDTDGYGNPAVFITTDSGAPAGYVADDTDCDDGDNTVHPGAAEVCGDGIDNDCDGSVDEDCRTWYQDSDGDTYGNPAVSVLSDSGAPVGYVADDTDCDDGDNAVHPGAAEVCGDGIDNDCDGSVDEDCRTWYQDNDGDNYGDPFTGVTTDSGPPAGYVADNTDCDDGDNAVHPGAAEVCGDDIDNDCDGSVDEDCRTWYQDSDGDTYGNPAVSVLTDGGAPVGYVADNTDCDDIDGAVNPGATEVCDGIDNDCDGNIDEGCLTWYQDGDSDTYGNPAVSIVASVPPAGYVNNNMDCDDADGTVNPGTGAEVCPGDGIDNNCNGVVDEGCTPLTDWYRDNDGDTYGDYSDTPVSAAGNPGGRVNNNMDCDDTDSAIYPGASEVCDGQDNNCDGNTDEGCQSWFNDSDGDTYGNPAVSIEAIVPPAWYVADNTDCDDLDALVNPGVAEVCADGIDNDCDGSIDEDCYTWYLDNDSDGYGDSTVLVITDTGPPAGYVADNTDCDDADILVNPGAFEVCEDGIDNDCDGSVDEDCHAWYQDADGDSYGDPSTGVTTDTGAPAGYVADNTDCDDGDNAVHPGAAEVCGDGIDNDCDGSVDEDCHTWYQDADGDSYGNPSTGVTTDSGAPAGYVVDNTDCDDGDNAVHPGAAEVCADGIDNDCDGSVDEDCHTWYQDADGDSYGNPSTGVTTDSGPPIGYVADDTDCDDGDGAVNPGTAEVCGDGIDNDCDGSADEDCQTWYQDSDGDTYGDPSTGVTTDSGAPAGYVSDNTDCDDGDNAVSPGVAEACGDGIDNDCDGSVDEDCQTWYQDSDGDTYGDPSTGVTTDSGAPAGYVSDNTDCDDGDNAVNPGTPETCGDGIDNDCDGRIEEGCVPWYQDSDNDGYGNLAAPVTSDTRPTGYVSDYTDCDDTRAFVHPGALEVCDGIDNNCVSGIDEGCITWYQDNDGDGYGSAISTVSILHPAGYVALPGDCDDTDPAINPAATEVFDGIDNDCDGGVDESSVVWYQDLDGDTYGDPSVSLDSIVQPAGYVGISGDCNDSDAAINPAATEVCDIIDNDCDGIADEGCVFWYQDNDGDGYGDSTVWVESIVQPPGYVTFSGDCNDADAAINPLATEVCSDGVDNDCDGSSDEGCVLWYQDNDGDTYGATAVTTVAVDQPAGYAARDGDCNDGNADIHPGAAETCSDGVDNDCDGSFDEGCVLWYQDVDGDNYGVSAVTTESVSQPVGFAGISGDCHDANAAVNPGATEVCDGIDNDCDGFEDEGCIYWYRDNDGDGYGSVFTVSSFTQPPGYVSVSGDCNDADSTIHTGSPEICDGLDNDCDGQIDETCLTWYLDSDNDHFGDPYISQRSVSRPDGYVAASGDCDDSDSTIRPFVQDLCDDKDNDCDLEYDEDVPDEEYHTYYRDNDGDGYGNPGIWVEDCMRPFDYVSDNTDCNDMNAAVHPGAFDICDNGVDEDCSAGGDPSGDRSCGSASIRGCANIANVPLETQMQSAPPIVMLLLDNSGSMGWDVMCAGEADGLFNGYSDSTTGNYEYWQAQYADKNNIYYDPNVEYTPWPDYPDADIQTPRKHPDGSPTTNLDSRFEQINNERGERGGTALDVKVAHYYAWSSTEQRPYLVFINNTSVTYYRIDPPGSGEVDPTDITGPVTASSVPDDAIMPQAWEDGDRECSSAEAAAARQNFANWYQYYRTRMLTANNTLAKVVAGASGIQIGVTTINVNSAAGFLEPVLVDDNIEAGHDGPANRQEVIDFIFEAGQPSGGTPLRRTFKSLGNYFDNAANDSRPSPWASADDGGECQMAFIIMMTDGYYNGANPNVDDTDGDDNTEFDGPPFADDHGQDDTLADIAMHYYERDLALNLENNVPSTLNDRAQHQHVVTYSISFGVIGTLDPAAYNFNLDSPGCSSWASCTTESPCNCVPYWPEIPNTNAGCAEKIDDLYHAAVNGRGKYFATSNVNQLSYALSTILSEITDRQGSGASVAVNSQFLQENVQIYNGTYNSASWSGDLTAWAVDPDDGSIATAYSWSAAEKLDDRALASNPRRIVTYNPDSANGVDFELGNLSTEQKDWLGSTDDERQRLIDFLKGDRSEEIHNGGALRDRNSRLGDIIHSAPVYKKYTSGAEYIFVGGNDGMLHVFNAASSGNGGQEVFAYIPGFVYENLHYLSDPTYAHKYFVDTTPYIDSTGLLVGGLGAGGKGYFALNVLSPTSFQGSNVLWEYPPGSDDDMGFSFAKPVIANHKSGRLVLLGNGYDSANGHAVLHILRLDANNSIVEFLKIDTEVGDQSTAECNGLSSPLATDVDFDKEIDFVYAGDLQGNLWKFDLTGATSAEWKVAYGTTVSPAPLFKAEYAAGVPQPIYAQPNAMRHCLSNRDGYILVFGTGKFFATGDFEDTSQQSIYGIWDWSEELEDGGIVDPHSLPLGAPTRIANRATLPVSLGGGSSVTFALLGQSVVGSGGDSFATSSNRLHDKFKDPDNIPDSGDEEQAWFDADAWQANKSTYTGERYVGWYFDLHFTGERVIADATLRSGLAIMVSIDPTPSPCEPGGNSVLTILNACDGSMPDTAVIDVDDDMIFDEGVSGITIDKIVWEPVFLFDNDGDDDSIMVFDPDETKTAPPETLGAAYWRYLRVVH